MKNDSDLKELSRAITYSPQGTNLLLVLSVLRGSHSLFLLFSYQANRLDLFWYILESKIDDRCSDEIVTFLNETSTKSNKSVISTESFYHSHSFQWQLLIWFRVC